MIHITEQVRKSALDVIRYNLYAAGCVSRFNISLQLNIYNNNSIETCDNTPKNLHIKVYFKT